MQRDASLTDSFSPDHCSFSSLELFADIANHDQ